MVKEPEFSNWLRELAASSKTPVVNHSEVFIKNFFKLIERIPEKYGWRVTSYEAFERQLIGVISSEKINRLYWHDIARNIEAYSIMIV